MVRLFWVAMFVVFAGATMVVFTRPDDGVAFAESAVSPGVAHTPSRSVEALPGIAVAPEPVTEPVEQTVEEEDTAIGAAVEDAPAVGVEQLAYESDAGAGLDALLGIAPAEEEESAVPGSGDESSGSAAEEVGEARAVDGGVVLGERFEVLGAGTAEEPYKIGWDVLMSAQETYRPRQGKKDIPAWVQQIDGKYVRVDGFIVLPVMGGVMNEVLLARNEWDGCCIGVPPTAYDSVEVRLRADASGKSGQHALNYGSIVGKMDVDPYLWKDWLISMYVMEDAVIERQGL